MKSKVLKWGNSLAIRIPKAFADETHLQDGVKVEITVEDGLLIIAPTGKGKVTLRSLLQLVTSENVHREVTTGPAVGNEAR